MDLEPVAEGDKKAIARPGRILGRALKRFLAWSLLNAVYITLLLLPWPSLLAGELDASLMQDTLVLGGVDVLVSVVFMVLPCALVSELRFLRGAKSKMHFVPYVGMIPYAIVIMALTGILSFALIPWQLIVLLMLHFLMARHYRKATRSSGDLGR
ncbi:hypothetical protein LO763_21875 [Glycomyces sp. A-F 0318]|uniref:hypothetical protein n=1 Tax=Glycomyces amatae TaxID=2881355 RepID=UPI001E55C908|nr:hypothetical protein [Glycomyces amatae]MCD0446265.1 hypothetical protein [Glycomyces amatae]